MESIESTDLKSPSVIYIWLPPHPLFVYLADLRRRYFCTITAHKTVVLWAFIIQIHLRHILATWHSSQVTRSPPHAPTCRSAPTVGIRWLDQLIILKFNSAGFIQLSQNFDLFRTSGINSRCRALWGIYYFFSPGVYTLADEFSPSRASMIYMLARVETAFKRNEYETWGTATVRVKQRRAGRPFFAFSPLRPKDSMWDDSLNRYFLTLRATAPWKTPPYGDFTTIFQDSLENLR